jgi:membrane protein implicated in regulation of membrane protease activity
MNLTLPQRLAIVVFRWGPAVLTGYLHGWWWGLVAFVLLLLGSAVIGWGMLERMSQEAECNRIGCLA